MAEPILITGVGRRVGLHMAMQFVERGIPVIGTYRSDRKGIAVLKNKGVVLYRCDFYDNARIEDLLTRITETTPGLRAIIHNASDWLPDRADLPSPEIFDRMMRVHAGAPYQINLALAPLLEASENAHADIIHIGDYVSRRGSTKHIAYAASKAAQDNLTLSFAAKLAPKVKVNSIAPALVLFNEDDDEAYREKALSKSLMQREAGLEEFQQTVDYILESHYVTGRVLHLDGGRHLR